MKKIIAILSLALSLSAGSVIGGEVLFNNNRTIWNIYLPVKAGQVESYAATELADSLKKISGADFKIIRTDKVPEKNAIILGTMSSAEIVKENAKNLNLNDKKKIETLAVYTLGGNLYLVGNNPRACLYSVYSFLQNQLDVRWLWPGAGGEFIVQKNNYTLPKLAWNYQPAFKFREMTPCCMHNHVPTEVWMARNFLNGGSRTKHIRDKAGFYRQAAEHYVSIDNATVEFKKRPEMFAQVNGKRVVEGTAGCWSSPEFLKYIVEKHKKIIDKKNLDILNTFPADHNVRCECIECTKVSNKTLRWFNFYAKLQHELKKTYPNLMFAGIAYQEYRKAPTLPIDGLEYIEYCQYNRCYIHKFSDQNCKLNRSSLDDLKAWQAKADMGIYGYEFDVFKPSMYVPFWNMLADEIKTFRSLGLKLIKTEMLVKYPKNASPEELPAQKSRLANYIYSRLLWNPDIKIDDLLDDWCRTVYGPAAAPMLAYHKTMAANWDKMKIHLSYFGANPAGTSRFFINQQLIDFAEKCFSKAIKLAKTIDDDKRRVRVESNVDLNKKLFLQWTKLYQISRENAVMVNLPLLKNKNEFMQAVKLPITSKGGKHKVTEAYMYWTADSLQLRVICYDQNMVKLKTGKTGRDINLWNDDHLEIFIECSDGAPYHHFAVNPSGGRYDANGNDKSWNPEWQVKTEIKADRWTADIRIPFAALDVIPKNGMQWLMVINRNSEPEACGFPNPSYHDPSSGAVIYFNNTVIPERTLTWIIPDGVFIEKYIPALLKNGWNFNIVQASKAMNINLKDSKFIVITTSSFIKGKMHWFKNQDDFYRHQIVPAVKNGAVLLINNYAKLSQFENVFDDASFKMQWSEKLDSLRKTIHITKSSFASQPDDMRKVLRITPPGVYTLACPDKWEFLATQYTKKHIELPYLLARPYGKGMVVISGLIDYGKTPSQVISLFNNLLAYNKNIEKR